MEHVSSARHRSQILRILVTSCRIIRPLEDARRRCCGWSNIAYSNMLIRAMCSMAHRMSAAIESFVCVRGLERYNANKLAPSRPPPPTPPRSEFPNSFEHVLNAVLRHRTATPLQSSWTNTAASVSASETQRKFPDARG